MRKKRKFNDRSAPQQQFNDGFSNLVGKLGFGNVDNQLSQGYFDFNYLTQNRVQLEAAHRGNWLCQALVDRIAEDMTRAGFTIHGEIDPDRLSDFQAIIQRKGIMQDIGDGIRWGRLFGGALALMLVDGVDYSKPFDAEKIKQGKFRGIKVYDRWRTVPNTNQLIQSGRDTGLPEMYHIIDLALDVHHTWLFRFIGDKLPYYQSVREMLWGASVLENVLDRIVAFESVTLGAANLVSRAHLRTIGVKGLRQIFAMGGQAEQNLVTMFQYIREMQNNEGITLIDSEDQFQTDSYQFSGLNDVTLQFAQQVAGAKRIPLTVLFGQSPAGLNATGDSDMRIYYDMISAQQNMRLDDDLKLLTVLYISEYGEMPPSDFMIKYNSLWQTTDQEKTDIAQKTVQTISQAYNDGAIDRSIYLKELKQCSAITGIFTNITDEELKEAENEPPTPQYEETETAQTGTPSRAELLNNAKELINGKASDND
ncbi:MAG TPA: DUF1073 domain-containing protein [Methanosarcina sp.]|nr:DUF1073 domain-containing protein [Methanosarcina sp.]